MMFMNIALYNISYSSNNINIRALLAFSMVFYKEKDFDTAIVGIGKHIFTFIHIQYTHENLHPNKN